MTRHADGTRGEERSIDWRRIAASLVPTESTRIVIEAGAASTLGSRLAADLRLASGARAMLVVDVNAAEAAGNAVERSLREMGVAVKRLDLEANEHRKTQAEADRILAAAIGHGVDRDSPIVAVGGGLIGDLAGHAASVLLRGVPLVLVPTTLLAMVDASIGGKTAVNVPLAGGTLGRNLVGSFWPASLVVIDRETLRTLPIEEHRSGLAESLKHAWIEGETEVEWIERRAESLADPASPGHAEAIGELIATSVRFKSAVVARDPLERGERRLLNLGHTFAHAIESQPTNRLRHGEAVAIGMVAAAAVAESVARAEAGTAARIRAVASRLGLPTCLEDGAALAALRAAMGFDKKRSGARLRLIIPRRPGQIEMVEAPPESAVEAGWRAVGAG
jgi:3-dehydroquinate synthase